MLSANGSCSGRSDKMPVILASGTAGNMICVHNVVAASAVVGLPGKEGSLIRKTLIPMIYYLIAAALIGFFLLAVSS
jgi:lactate permease